MKSFFYGVYRHMLWIAPPLMAIAVVLLVLSIRNLIGLVREAKVLSVPLVEQQSIDFREGGKVVLCLEGPLFTTRFAGLTYELRGEEGAPVEGRAVWFRTKTSGASWVRMELRSYEIPQPGRYVLRVRGLGEPEEEDARNRLVFMKPHLYPSVGYTIGITLSALVFIASLVIFLQRLLENRQES